MLSCRGVAVVITLGFIGLVLPGCNEEADEEGMALSPKSLPTMPTSDPTNDSNDANDSNDSNDSNVSNVSESCFCECPNLCGTFSADDLNLTEINSSSNESNFTDVFSDSNESNISNESDNESNLTDDFNDSTESNLTEANLSYCINSEDLANELCKIINLSNVSCETETTSQFAPAPMSTLTASTATPMVSVVGVAAAVVTSLFVVEVFAVCCCVLGWRRWRRKRGTSKQETMFRDPFGPDAEQKRTGPTLAALAVTTDSVTWGVVELLHRELVRVDQRELLTWALCTWRVQAVRNATSLAHGRATFSTSNDRLSTQSKGLRMQRLIAAKVAAEPCESQTCMDGQTDIGVVEGTWFHSATDDVIIIRQERDRVLIQHSRLGKVKTPVSKFLRDGKLRYAGFTGTIEHSTIRWNNGTFWSKSKDASKDAVCQRFSLPPTLLGNCVAAEPDDVRLTVLE
jgi:hypothetical protein